MLLHTVIALFQVAVATSRLTGLVTDTEGRPLPGVSVEARASSEVPPRSILTLTRSDGTFELPPPPPGGLELTALLDGFEPNTSPLHVGSSSATPVIRLRRTADTVLVCTCDPVLLTAAVYNGLPDDLAPRYIVTLREFRVVDTAGKPIPGATVELRGLYTLTLKSDHLGRVCYSGTDGEFCHVRIDAPGFLSLRADPCCIADTATLRRPLIPGA
jgi:hypothetical protein